MPLPTRPVFAPIPSQQQGWDAPVNTNFGHLREGPWPVFALDDTFDETDLEAEFPVANYRLCLVWVKHSTLGWVLYASVATGAWFLLGGQGSPASLMKEVTAEGITIVAGTAKLTFRMPYAMTVTEVRANLVGASSSGVVTVDINVGGTTILGTKLTIDSGEKTSLTAAAPATITNANLADDAEITIDVDTAGTGAHGLKVTLKGGQA